MVGLVIGGIWTAASAAREAFLVSRTSSDMLGMWNAANTLFSGQSIKSAVPADTCQVLTATMAPAGGIPAHLLHNGIPRHPWGGMIAPTSCNMLHRMPEIGVYLYALVPSRICTAILSKVTGGDPDPKAFAAFQYLDGKPNLILNGFPIAVDQLQTVCSGELAYFGFYKPARPN